MITDEAHWNVRRALRKCLELANDQLDTVRVERDAATEEARTAYRALDLATAERDAYLANLTTTQERCTELIRELRSLKRDQGNRVEIPAEPECRVKCGKPSPEGDLHCNRDSHGNIGFCQHIFNGVVVRRWRSESLVRAESEVLRAACMLADDSDDRASYQTLKDAVRAYRLASR